MKPFGHKSRMDNLSNSRAHSPGALDAQVRDIAHWYRRMYAELNPSRPRLDAIKLIYVKYPVGEGTPGAPGHWKTLPLDEIRPDRHGVIAEYRFDEP